ncbi:MAG: HDOD domain-containing protein [Betaproteobacteria bacterium]|jgi:HD-like signal output (HDOD) protein
MKKASTPDTLPSTPPREITPDDIEKVFKTITIPPCPAVVVDAMREAQKDMPDIARLSKTISADVAMTAATLKLANSPMFRGSAPIANVRRAIDRIGTLNVVCVVVAAALRQSIEGGSSARMEQFWRQTSALALAAGLIAHRHYGIPRDMAYLYALFHDIGIPLMATRFPAYDEAVRGGRDSGKLLVLTEAEYFPCTHPVIGWLTIRSWGLPDDLGTAVRYHHDPDVYDMPETLVPDLSKSLMATVHVAEHLMAALVDDKDYEVGDPLFQRGLSHLGITQIDLEHLREEINEVMDD